MSIRSDAGKPESDVTGLPMEMPASTDAALGEGSSYCVASPDNPLHRNLVVSIRASLNDLCLSKSKGTWMPSSEALKAMLQQRKFTSLGGESDHQGDLKSVVLHDLKVDHVSSTFPISLGARVSGVDDNTFTSTGEAFSMVVLPHSNSPVERILQKDDVSLAYEFAKKFPGYTSGNLSDKGVHEVSARRFVLVAADHPLVSAISENAEKLQMGEISMMPEGLVKISTGLYDSILPLVKTQVESQIKVRDFSRASVSITPAEYGSWADARDDLITEEKRPLRAQMEAEISDAGGDAAKIAKIRNNFASQERMLESEIDHKPLEMHLSLGISYNFLSK
jgi:hypothetical protein